MTAPWVLDEDDALELLAYLVTAARTQVDEAAEYGPMRLLTAAHRLAEAMGPRSSAETAAALAGPLADMPLLAVPRRPHRVRRAARRRLPVAGRAPQRAVRAVTDPVLDPVLAPSAAGGSPGR